jgi:hypothetical protein
MSWILLVIVLVAIGLAAWSFSRGARARPQPAVSTHFVPDPKNDKVIVVEGWDDTDLRKVIDDFIDAYNSDGYPEYTIEPQKRAEKAFSLTFPKDIHPVLFTFLVNYIGYPFDLGLTGRSIVVGGKTTLTSLFVGIDPSIIGQKAILYLPENDQDHDIVYLRSASGVTFANSFTELVWRRVNDARLAAEVRQLMDGV